MLKFFKKILLLLFLGLLMPGYGQETVTETEAPPKLVIKARAIDNAIYLRWGVNLALAWKYGNQYGYRIERATIFRNGQPLQNPEKIILTGAPIKPKPIDNWRSFIETNNMAAVAAQAIYGENFNIDNGDENPVIRVINQSSELQQRFAFSMFALDQNFEAATYAGLGFIDSTVKANEKYLYNIKMAVPEELMKIDETGLIISPADKVPLPKPYDFAGYYYNNSFVLIWEYDALQYVYTSYDLEKSEDGKNFSKINEVPITKLADTQVSGISFTDSIPQYGKKYWYRISGRTFFDEKSPFSDTVSVIAYKKLLVAPELKKNEIVSETEVVLNWDFAQDEAWKLTHFDILRAEKAIGPYASIIEGLDAKERSYRYNEVKDINYFKIRAHGIGGDYQDSSPNMIQPIDSIPPLKPQGLNGQIDTLGIVRLSWNKNTELDLKGYTILRANRPNQEFTRLNKQEITRTNFTDTVNLKSFNTKVFYELIAADNRYNESEPSTVLVLDRPDMKPPTSPVFESYEILGDTIALKWIKSSSENVAKQIIYRKQINDDQETLWENIYEAEANENVFKDVNTAPNTKYVYTIVAKNGSNVESNPSPPLSIMTTNNFIKPKVKGLFSTVNREKKFIQLNWRYQEVGIVEIQLFRKIGEGNFSLYQTLSPETKQFIDDKLDANSVYTYGFKVIFNDGSISEWGEIEVKY